VGPVNVRGALRQLVDMSRSSNPRRRLATERSAGFTPTRRANRVSTAHASRSEAQPIEVSGTTLQAAENAQRLSSRFRIFPVGPFGRLSLNSTMRGYL
jgi:hypothetical protein